ncbi:hypothetical protein F4808DRAFT_181185 [Astrocystis sublimbata]|nr:hypothetical protein F4808DRAFT_181185 [Astrocystis sublimbata]
MSSRKRRESSSAGPYARVDPGHDEPLSKRRQASLYDAVAGRVTTTLPIGYYESQRSSVKHHEPVAPDSRRNPTLAPEEVLFKRAGAPIRYAEKDIYQAHEHLPHGGQGVLPDSDLLKAIHSYVSHFYKDLPANKHTVHGEAGEGVSERSMDETALLSFGILLEEMSREALGNGGDLVFTEGMELREDEGAIGEAETFGFLEAPRHEARGRM